MIALRTAVVAWVVGLAACSGAPPTALEGSEGDESTEDALRRAISFACAADDSCSEEESLGYCVEGIGIERTANGRGRVTLGRYSSVADQDYGAKSVETTKLTASARSVRATWTGGELSAQLDASAFYRGRMVIDGATVEISCVPRGEDPCVRAKKNGTYCGANLTVDRREASTLFTCKNGVAVRRQACRDACGDSFDRVGLDSCR